jgi:hypothetical protein
MKSDILQIGARHLRRALLLRLVALALTGFGTFPGRSFAQDCGTTTREIPAITHTEHYPAITVFHEAVYEYVPPVIVHHPAIMMHHPAVVVHHPAVTHVEYDENGEPYVVEDSPAWDEEISPAWDEEISPAYDEVVTPGGVVEVSPAWTEVLREAYSEVIVDVPAQTITVPAACTWTTSRTEAAPWAPATNTVALGVPFTQNRTVKVYVQNWSRGDAGPNGEPAPEVPEAETLASETTETQPAFGTGDAEWEGFDEFVAWNTGSPPGDEFWTPARSTVPDGEWFEQTATVQIEYRRRGQRDGAGNERNVEYYWTTEVQTRPNTGTGPAGPGGTKTAQTINFPQPANMRTTDGNGGIDLGATASSGLPVSYVLLSGNGTFHDNRLYLLGPGTLTVRAEQSGNTQYAAASVERTFSVAGPSILADTESQASNRSLWRDVNGDGILDEIIFPGTDRFTMSLSLATQIIDISSLFPNSFFAPLTFPGHSNDGPSPLPQALWWDWDSDPSYDLSTVSFTITFNYEFEPGWDYQIYTTLAHLMGDFGQWIGIGGNPTAV